jgi:putative photosynthetic complex assembly protein 2
MSWLQLYLYPILTTILFWTMFTVVLLVLNRSGKTVSRIALVGSMLTVFALAHYQLWVVRNDLSVGGIYWAFICAMTIWVWHELAFFSGVITGPWRKACPPNVHGWKRFGYALATHLYHGIAVLVEIFILWWLQREAANWFGLLTFALCWSLLLSAKINVFLGVPNLQVTWFPEHLRYLATFWKKKSYNLFFVFSVVVTTILAIVLWIQANRLAPTDPAIGVSFLAGLATLGVIEHWMLIIPAPGSRQQATGSSQEVAPPGA